MLHQTWSTRNDYERKINYDWPKTHFHQDEKLFELFCAMKMILLNILQILAIHYFVLHILIISRNDTFLY